VAAVSLLRLPLHHLNWPEAPYLLFAVAVLIAAGFGGFGPGLAAIVLSVVLGNFLFAIPYFTLDFQAPAQMGRAAVFVIDGLLISILGGRLRTARQHEETAAREARALQAEILEIAERERDRFGHDLHDGLGQHLTATALLAGALARRLQEPQERDSANQIASLLDEAVEQTRDLARGLAPLSLRAGGLPAAIRELGASAQRLFGVPCETDCDPSVQIADEDIAIQLYRVAQEAITNAAKHGGSSVYVALRNVDDSIELEVRDRGIGFDSNRRGYQGVGLNIMAYRAQRAGARLIIRSALNQGTSVRCTLAKGAASA